MRNGVFKRQFVRFGITSRVWLRIQAIGRKLRSHNANTRTLRTLPPSRLCLRLRFCRGLTAKKVQATLKWTAGTLAALGRNPDFEAARTSLDALIAALVDKLQR
jgi:hypothetical protein